VSKILQKKDNGAVTCNLENRKKLMKSA